MEKVRKSWEHFKDLTAYGVTKPLAYWSDLTGLSVNVIRKRVRQLKMSPEEALTNPPKSLKEWGDIHESFGQKHTLREWADRLNVSYQSLSYRLNVMKLPIDQVLSTQSLSNKKTQLKQVIKGNE